MRLKVLNVAKRQIGQLPFKQVLTLRKFRLYELKGIS